MFPRDTAHLPRREYAACLRPTRDQGNPSGALRAALTPLLAEGRRSRNSHRRSAMNIASKSIVLAGLCYVLSTALMPVAHATDGWSRMNAAPSAPPAVTAYWAGALADDRSNFARNTAGSPTAHYIAPTISWTRIQTPHGSVLVSTLSSKCEAPNSASALDIQICEYAIASETAAFPPLTASGCFTESDLKQGTEFRFDPASNALQLRVIYNARPQTSCASVIPLHH